MQHDIVIHVWSDLACPWCFIAKQRLEKGIELSGQKVAVEYHAYQLEPDAPTSPTHSQTEHLMNVKKVDESTVEDMLAQVSKQGRDVGIEFNWDKIAQTNTFLAHQLVYAAKAAGETPEEAAIAGAQMVERLFRARFTEGRNIADAETLIDIADEMGLVAEDVQDVIESGEYADDVRHDIRDAQALGVTGVPFFVVGGKLGLSGAQSPETFAETINRAIDEIKAEPAGWRP